MKIGIITFHHSKSYGAILQSYALCKILNNLGHEAVIIDYKPWKILFPRIGLHLRTIIRPKLFLINLFLLRPVLRCFIRKHIPLSKKSYWTHFSLKRKPPIYDYYITGSDQVWNTTLFSYFDTNYILDFARHENSKLMSYGASFGQDQPSNMKPILASLLKRINYISVRERHGFNLVKALTDKYSKVVCDPVFLLNSYNDVIVKPSANYDYIAVFCLDKTSNFIILVEQLQKQTNLPVINLGTLDLGFEVNKKYINPGEWLGYLKNAKFVITNSFHGVSFSIIFKKNFFVYPIKDRFVRISELLNYLGLESRVTERNDVDNHNLDLSDINYSKIDLLIKDKVNYSMDFIIKSIT